MFISPHSQTRMGCTCSIQDDTTEVSTTQVEVVLAPEPLSASPRVTMYGASWCPWCKKQSKEFEKGRGKYTYVVHMCDVTRCDDSITTLPTLVLEAPDRPTVRLLGYHTSEALERELGIGQ